MGVFESFLSGRDQAPTIELTDAQRLLRFDAWVKGELEKRLDWAWAGAHRVKRVEQCRVQIEGLVLDLRLRGWMLDARNSRA